ncbi:zinc-binding dehydrogenase [Leucobacter weissii]|uniref:Zinc-binding dehydrogenase n=1 Tax=Leucobacter weissii TaxID=1983706 RepID=A0A939MGC8_9MICO|nr:zinc-binding dehydrogenase [Leucobacter weissii]MBO1900374.1 zinc-binding dehydrogenase [Leucobacter weissii]
MRALALTGNAAAPGLALVERPAPVPAAGEITVDVEAAGVGLIDALWATGAMPQQDGFVPGLEVAGTVRELGDGVTAFEPGQHVAAILPGAGGFAEVARASAALVAPIPDGMDVAQASVVPVNTVTAHLALTTVARFARGEAVLVHAAAGGLGSQFGQIARTLGAGRVDVVVGAPAKRGTARDLGYDHAYLRDRLPDVPERGYDIVVDPVGGEATADAFRVLREGGRLLRVGNASQAPDVAVSSVAHWLENKTTTGFNVGAWLSRRPEDGAASLRWSLAAVASGEIDVPLTGTAALGECAALLERLLSGATVGKLALLID